MISATMI